MSFSLFGSTSETRQTYHAFLADFDGDGDLDWFNHNVDAFPGSHDIYINNGNGTFSHGTAGDSLSNLDAAVGDIDNDGDADLIYAKNSGNNIEKCVNNGSASFTCSIIINTFNNNRNVRLGDVDLDGDLDIHLGGQFFATNFVYLNSHGVFTPAASTMGLMYDQTLNLADFTGDGILDAAYLQDTSGHFIVVQGSGTGAYIPIFEGAVTYNHQDLASGDFDGDGDIDAVVVDGSDDVLTLFNDGDGTNFTPSGSASGNSAGTVYSVEAGDIDNDGDLDLIVGGSTGHDVYLNNGAGVFTQSGSPTEPSDIVRAISIGDLDTDGDLDFIAATADTIPKRIYKSDQAATTANTAPSAPSSNFDITLHSRKNRLLTVASNGTAFSRSRIVVPADGKPFIVLHSTSTDEVVVVKCGNRFCSSGNTTTNTGYDTNGHLALAIASDGMPIFAYYDTTLPGLQVVKCNNATCTSRTQTYSVTGDVGSWPSMTVPADGRPVISYHDFDANRLNMIRCADMSCASALDTAIDGSANVGTYTSIAIASDGFPMIAYHDNDNGGVKTVHCGNADCTTSNNIQNPVTDSDLGNGISMVIPSDGKPFIAHNSQLSDLLHFVKCGDAHCSSGNTSGTFGSVGAAQMASVFIGSDGFPTVVFNESSGFYVAHCLNAGCTSKTETLLYTSDGLYPSAVAHDDGMPVVLFNDDTTDLFKLLECGDDKCQSGGTNGEYIYRLSWGSGSDTHTPTRLLQYQVKLGTGSSTHNIVSGKTTSPLWTNRLMPNDESRYMYLRNLPCGLTYYWSVAAVDTGFRQSWSSEQQFLISSTCGASVVSGGGSPSTPNVGGGLPASYFRTNEGGGGTPGYGRIEVAAYHDVDASDTKSDRELYAFRGLSLTASGRTAEDIVVHRTVVLGEGGRASIELPVSDDRGYWLSVDSNSSIIQGYVSTGLTSSGGYVVSDGSAGTVNFGFRRKNLLAYKPCLFVSPEGENETSGIDAQILLQRLQDSFGSSLTKGIDFADELITRKEFFTLLARSQCVSLVRNAQELEERVRAEAKIRNIRMPLIDLPIDPAKPDSLLVYSLFAAGADIGRSTSQGLAADLASPLKRDEAVRVVASIVPIPESRRVREGGVLPDDMEPTDPLIGDFLTLQSIEALPESFLPIFGASQGMDPEETALMIIRAALRGGRISLLPEFVTQKKSAAPEKTFLSTIPVMKPRSCLEKDSSRSTSVSFSDVLPGDYFFSDLREVLSRGTRNSAKQVLWLLSATIRPTEFGIVQGQTRAALEEPATILETIRNLLVLSCLPPPTALDVLSGKYDRIVTQGSAETRIPRDRISNLKRDATFASRVLYRSQDHQKEFDLSLFTFFPSFLRDDDVRSPGSGLSVLEGSDLLASGLLMIAVKERVMSPMQAEQAFEELSAAIRKDLLGKTVDWREESKLRTTPFTRGMLVKFLSTVVSGRTLVSTSAASLPLGDIWWDRIR